MIEVEDVAHVLQVREVLGGGRRLEGPPDGVAHPLKGHWNALAELPGKLKRLNN